MTKKLVLLVLVLVLLVSGVIFFVAGGRRGAVRGSTEKDQVAQPASEAAPLPETILEPSEATTLVAGETRVEVAAERATSMAITSAGLSGITGRVVEDGGTPVANMHVSLVEFQSSILFDGAGIDAEEQSLELEETVTNAEGRFRLDGATVSCMHGLGVDIGGPRATLRVLDQALVPGQHTDVGDIVLAPFGVITGRVVDEAGAPVSGARVRFGPYPEEVLRASPHEFRSDSMVAVSMLASRGDGQGVIEPPQWIRHVIERFPIPTTATKADGTFRLEGVALAKVIGAVDRTGYVGVPLGPIDLEGGSHDAGTVVLKRGRTVRGVVEDSSGDAVAGAEVLAGAELYPGTAAILQPCGKTDADGHFELTGVAETGQIIAAARRAPHERWGTTVTAKNDGVLVELETTVQLTVNVRDQEGKPVTGATVRIVPKHRDEESPAFLGFVNLIPKPVPKVCGFVEGAPGRYVNASLSAGLYSVTARAAGFAPSWQEVDCVASESEVTLTLGAGRRIELSVVQAGTKAPIAGARASVLRAGGAGFTKLSVSTTDADGRAVIGPLGDIRDEPRTNEFLPNETILLVQHPVHGEYSDKLDVEQLPLHDVPTVVVELRPGGTLAGRVHWAGAEPTVIYMLTLQFQDADGFLEFFHLPRFALTGLTGEFRVADLAPGNYRVELSERFLQNDPLALMASEFDPPTLHRAEFDIKSGETTELDIDLTPTGRGALARLVGRVRFDGRGLEGAKVNVRGNEHVEVTTDASGRFETQPFSVMGNSWISIDGEVPLGDGSTRQMQLYAENVELKNDDVHEIDLDLYPHRLRARVVADATGEPLAEADVTVHVKGSGWDRQRGNGQTDASGEVELLVLETGEHTLEATAAGFGQASTVVNITSDGTAETPVLRLARSVPCSGRIERGPDAPTEGFAYVVVRSASGEREDGAMISPPEDTFTLENLTPGKYVAQIYLTGQMSQEIEFELGPDGDENLLFYFVPVNPLEKR